MNFQDIHPLDEIEDDGHTDIVVAVFKLVGQPAQLVVASGFVFEPEECTGFVATGHKADKAKLQVDRDAIKAIERLRRLAEDQAVAIVELMPN